MNNKFKLKKNRDLTAFWQKDFLILSEILMETKLTYFKIFKENFKFSSTFLVNPQLPMTSAKNLSSDSNVGQPPPSLCCEYTYACAKLQQYNQSN